MFTNVKKMLTGTKREAGFTLVELLIVILIVGILSAVALPLYLGYTKDARLAEGKAVGGSALTALSGCVQAKGTGSNCVVSEVRNRVGLDGSNATYDGRWVVGAALSVDNLGALAIHPTGHGAVLYRGRKRRDIAVRYQFDDRADQQDGWRALLT